MVNEWSLRQEVLERTHRWPVIVAFCLAGALLGWIVSFAWPAPYRAGSELYVGINAYRALDDNNVVVEFNYPDDYKNWQMANLNVMVKMEDVLRETLDHLRQKDPAWNETTREDLALMLNTYWRNAGRWRLVAEHPDPQRAAEAVTAWQKIALARVETAIFHSRQVMLIDAEIQANAAAQVEAQTHLQQLENQANATPAELEAARSALAALEAEQSALATAYADSSAKSLGISAEMEVKAVSDAAPQITHLRPAPLLALIGGALGLLAWMAQTFAAIALRRRA